MFCHFECLVKVYLFDAPKTGLLLSIGTPSLIKRIKGNGAEWIETVEKYTWQQRRSDVNGPRHSAKSAGGRLQLNMHAPYICGFAWSDVVHGCMVCTERAEMAAVSCGTSHASAVSTPLRWILKKKKKQYKKLFTRVKSHASAVSLL